VSYLDNGRVCDECGRQDDDPEIITPSDNGFRNHIYPGWFTLINECQITLHACPICVKMRFGHLLQVLDAKKEIT